jgi:hypothetical protein
MCIATGLSKKCSLLSVGVLVVFFISTAPMFGQSAPASTNPPLVAGPNRPTNVPEGYVVTPFGFFHPSCLQSIAAGETLLADGRIQHAGGTVPENTPVCKYPRYTHSGLQVAAEANTAPEVNGWIESASIITGSASQPYGALFASWKVPPQPAAQDGQVLFIFPGFQDLNDPQTSILQPVLQWAGGQWAVANWNCCPQNITTESKLVKVSPGDTIQASITNSCRPGTVSCAKWNITSLDVETGKSTTLRHTPSEGQVFNWAFGGVLEPYYVISCDDYPQNQQATLSVLVLDENLHPVQNPQWGVSTNYTQTPQCNYGVQAQPYEISLDY